MAPSLRAQSHEGLSAEQLPALRPATDARTPLEAAQLRTNIVDSSGAAGAAASGSSTDVLQQLRAVQEDAASTVLGSGWGEAERRLLAVLEESSNVDAKEAEDDVSDAFEDGPAPQPNVVDPEGFQLLHYAGMYGSTEAIRRLMRAKANINGRTKVHETPLILAAFYRHAEACALLLAHGARQDLADWQGRTALAAAKASHFGHGPHNNNQAKAQCIEILATKAAEWKPPKEAEEFRAQGNDFFKKKQYKEAAASYSLGLSFSEESSLYANRAACYLNMERFVEAKMDAQKAVGLSGESGHEKASFRLAKAALSLGELDRADEAVRDGLKVFPKSSSLEQMKREVAVERRRRRGEA